MRFDDHFLDEIRARLSVSQVVGRRVALKKKGREYAGLSPFKVERTPSFFVNDQKGFYHCFASGEHGDIFKFLMTTEGLSFPEAVERLAGEAGVPMPVRTHENRERAVEIQDERQRLYALLEASAVFFRQQLHANAGAEARRYIEQRGLKRETIAAFGLGFIIGPTSGGYMKSISSTGQVDWVGYLAAGLCLINLVMAYFLLPESLKEKQKNVRFNFRVISGIVAELRKPTIRELLLINFIFITAFMIMQISVTPREASPHARSLNILMPPTDSSRSLGPLPWTSTTAGKGPFSTGTASVPGSFATPLPTSTARSLNFAGSA